MQGRKERPSSVTWRKSVKSSEVRGKEEMVAMASSTNKFLSGSFRLCSFKPRRDNKKFSNNTS